MSSRLVRAPAQFEPYAGWKPAIQQTGKSALRKRRHSCQAFLPAVSPTFLLARISRRTAGKHPTVNPQTSLPAFRDYRWSMKNRAHGQKAFGKRL